MKIKINWEKFLWVLFLAVIVGLAIRWVVRKFRTTDRNVDHVDAKVDKLRADVGAVLKAVNDENRESFRAIADAVTEVKALPAPKLPLGKVGFGQHEPEPIC